MLVLAQRTRCVWRALGGQRFPAVTREDGLIFLVGLLAIRDSNFPLQALQLLLLGWVFRGLQAGIDDGIHGGIDTADEEAGNARHLAEVATVLGELFQACDVSFGYFYVDVLREQQGYIDVDAFADGLLKWRECPRRCRGF